MKKPHLRAPFSPKGRYRLQIEIIGCIMSYRYDISSLTNDNLYCSDCIGTIAGHLADHH